MVFLVDGLNSFGNGMEVRSSLNEGNEVVDFVFPLPGFDNVQPPSIIEAVDVLPAALAFNNLFVIGYDC